MTTALIVLVLALISSLIFISRMWGKDSVKSDQNKKVVEEAKDAKKIKIRIKKDDKYRNRIRDHFKSR